MTLQEPKVEFVPIDKNVFVQAASACPTGVTNEPGAGGGQRCIASQEDAHDCPDWDTFIPFSGPIGD